MKACRELGITSMSLAPTMIAMLLEHPGFTAADLRTVRTISYGASAMPATLLNRLLAETDVGLCQSYGMTELSGSVSFLTVQDHQLAADGPGKKDMIISGGENIAPREVEEVLRRHAAGKIDKPLLRRLYGS